jgi:hypothetical protein
VPDDGETVGASMRTPPKLPPSTASPTSALKLGRQEVERFLAHVVEDRASSALDAMDASGRPSALGSDERHAMASFIAFQMVRALPAFGDTGVGPLGALWDRAPLPSVPS